MTAPVVALTFDDGPSSYRPRTLEILREARVRATFFEVGMRVEANPQLVAFAVREGHQVLNHTAFHRKLTGLSPAEIRAEVIAAEFALAAALRATPRSSTTDPSSGLAMRAPFLAVDDAVRAVLADIGYVTVVDADIRTEDSDAATPAEQLRDEVFDQLHPGGVVVLHDGNIDTPAGRSVVTALPEIIAGVRARGYRFGALDERGRVVDAGPLRPCAEPIPPIVKPVPYLPLVSRLRGDPPQDPPSPFTIVVP